MYLTFYTCLTFLQLLVNDSLTVLRKPNLRIIPNTDVEVAYPSRYIPLYLLAIDYNNSLVSKSF